MDWTEFPPDVRKCLQKYHKTPLSALEDLRDQNGIEYWGCVVASEQGGDELQTQALLRELERKHRARGKRELQLVWSAASRPRLADRSGGSAEQLQAAFAEMRANNVDLVRAKYKSHRSAALNAEDADPVEIERSEKEKWAAELWYFMQLANLPVISVLAEQDAGWWNCQRMFAGWEATKADLVVPELLNFWSGHSARHWLPTWAANVGIAKSDRDYLGRWMASSQESNAYILSARQAVFNIQAKVNKALCEGHEGVNESELLEELKDFGEARNVQQRRGHLRHRIWRRNNAGQWFLEVDYPAIATGWDMLGADPEVSLNEPEPCAGEVEGKERETKLKFWVAVTRKSSFRRLHWKCVWIVPQLSTEFGIVQ
ncbi:unnamed protein product [Effrenium voratum]|nr:unnamed protein product [Effrenium voratum]